MIRNTSYWALILSTTVAFSLGQNTSDEDTTAVQEENSTESFHDLYIMFDQEQGNTDHIAAGAEYSFNLIGDWGKLEDTEFSISLAGSYASLSDEPYALDGNFHTQFDLWANMGLSPFFFYDYTFDRSLGLIHRHNFAVGAKKRLGRVFSLSYAFMYEMEEYDSTRVFPRHSIRPKVKFVLNDGAAVIDYRTYYKPKLDMSEYLWENELKISLATFYELLSIDFSFKHSFNSRYDDSEILKPEDEWDYDYDTDELTPVNYKPTDYSVSLGLSFSM